MLIIEIAIGVFLGGMGLWLFVAHRDKQKRTEQNIRQEQLGFNAAEKYITEQFKTLTAECVNDFRGHLATIFDDPNRSAIEAASSKWELSREHLEEVKKQVEIEAREALKESFSVADGLGARERLDQHIDRLISDSINSVSNEIMLIYTKELQSFNDDDLPSVTHGHPRKQFNLGNAHRLGENVEQDYQKAERFLRQSAIQGYTNSEALLGAMYCVGEGVAQNYVEALKWLRLAAAKGDAFSLYNIGTMYCEGQGVAHDNVEASMWFLLAAAKGHSNALHNLVVIGRALTPVQIAQAENLALAIDKDVLKFILRQSEDLLPDPLSIYDNPELLAEYFTDKYLAPILWNYKSIALPTRSEIERWSITDHELVRCIEEGVLLGAMGTVETVKNNKSADYYTAFIFSLALRVEKLLSLQGIAEKHDEIIKVIEHYMDDLGKGQMVEFACTLTERVFSGNENQSAIFATEFWYRVFNVGMGTMGASKEFFMACMSAEIMQRAKKSADLHSD